MNGSENRGMGATDARLASPVTRDRGRVPRKSSGNSEVQPPRSAREDSLPVKHWWSSSPYGQWGMTLGRQIFDLEGESAGARRPKAHGKIWEFFLLGPGF